MVLTSFLFACSRSDSHASPTATEAPSSASSPPSAPPPPSTPPIPTEAVGAGSTGHASLAPRPKIPPTLIAVLSRTPYVEQACEDAPLPGGEPALRCAYETLGKKASVVVLDPPADRVARWIVDATAEIPALAALAKTDRAAWEEALGELGKDVLIQSSRIFPISGEVIEDMGKGPRAFTFDRGVSLPCRNACPCRINSITPRAWCEHRASQGEAEKECRERFRGPEGEERWRAHCLETHLRARNAESHPHFRAMLWWMRLFVDEACPDPKLPCTPTDVLAGLTDGRAAWRRGERKKPPKR